MMVNKAAALKKAGGRCEMSISLAEDAGMIAISAYSEEETMKRQQTTASCAGAALLLLGAALPAPLSAQESQAGSGATGMQGGQMPQMMMSPGMMMPSMDAANGRKLFAAKGCVVCHAVNGIGGEDAAALDASTMPGMTNPFDFVANMWRGAPAMIDMQREELGEQIQFTGQELADIIAFLHHEQEQKKFSDADIPPNIKAVMTRGQEETSPMKGMEMNTMNNMNMNNTNGQAGTDN
jgi:mono/diheme cytochrome c family protein